MSIDFQRIEDSQFDEFMGVLSHVFGFDPKDEDTAAEKKVFEFDRSIAAFESGRIVGTGGAYTFEMTIPGGAIPAGGVTVIGVLPTHRRRGILNNMMKRLLDDGRDRDEPVSILWASESVIYGRYGYGIATNHRQLEIERTHTKFEIEPEVSGQMSLISTEEASKRLPEIYDRARLGFPGALNRTPAKWEVTLADLEHWRDGMTANRFALYEEDGQGLGYLRYRMKEKWENGLPQMSAFVGELVALNPSAYFALWRHAFSLDLVSKIHAHNRPSREAVGEMLADPRRLTVKNDEGIWVRILDVAAALSARRYRADGSLVLKINDPIYPDLSGAFRLEVGSDGAECSRTENAADLEMDTRSLGACYLGESRFVELVASGRVRGSMEAARLADLMFGWHQPTWCPVGF